MSDLANSNEHNIVRFDWYPISKKLVTKSAFGDFAVLTINGRINMRTTILIRHSTY